MVPIPTLQRPLISNLRVRGHHIGPDDSVFSSRKGTPVDEHNIAHRHLTPIGEKLGFQLSWHVFNRAHVSLAKEAGMALLDRMASAGHSDARTSSLYTKDSIDSRLIELDRMGSKIPVH